MEFLQFLAAGSPSFGSFEAEAGTIIFYEFEAESEGVVPALPMPPFAPVALTPPLLGLSLLWYGAQGQEQVLSESPLLIPPIQAMTVRDSQGGGWIDFLQRGKGSLAVWQTSVSEKTSLQIVLESVFGDLLSVPEFKNFVPSPGVIALPLTVLTFEIESTIPLVEDSLLLSLKKSATLPGMSSVWPSPSDEIVLYGPLQSGPNFGVLLGIVPVPAVAPLQLFLTLTFPAAWSAHTLTLKGQIKNRAGQAGVTEKTWSLGQGVAAWEMQEPQPGPATSNRWIRLGGQIDLSLALSVPVAGGISEDDIQFTLLQGTASTVLKPFGGPMNPGWIRLIRELGESSYKVSLFPDSPSQWWPNSVFYLLAEYEDALGIVWQNRWELTPPAHPRFLGFESYWPFFQILRFRGEPQIQDVLFSLESEKRDIKALEIRQGSQVVEPKNGPVTEIETWVWLFWRSTPEIGEIWTLSLTASAALQAVDPLGRDIENLPSSLLLTSQKTAFLADSNPLLPDAFVDQGSSPRLKSPLLSILSAFGRSDTGLGGKS